MKSGRENEPYTNVGSVSFLKEGLTLGGKFFKVGLPTFDVSIRPLDDSLRLRFSWQGRGKRAGKGRF